MGNTIVGVGVGVGVGVDDLPLPLLPLLPEEVVIEILLWVPAISLLRFKYVCKSWRDLIQSPFFIHLHTATTFFNSSSKQQLDGDTFILQTSVTSLYKLGRGGRSAMERKMFMLSFGSGSGSESGSSGGGDDDQVVVFKLDDLGFPPYYKVFPWTHKIDMVGSCNGLICLHDSKLRDVSLWNPATRQFRILPKSITFFQEEDQEEEEGIGRFCYNFVAFGFDVKTKDYKVVQISCFGSEQWRPECSICRVQVYSLSTDSWRLLEGINSLPAQPNELQTLSNHGLYLNGSYFFVGKKCPPKLLSIEQLNEQGEIRNNSLLVSFDFTKEIFTTMQFPDHDRRYDFLLTHLGDKIVLFTTRIKSSFRPHCDCGDDDFCDCDYDDENYDIWVLNEQGGDVNEESWTKLHSFRIKDGVVKEWILPRGILNNGEFALIEKKTETRDDDVRVFNELQLLNLVTKEPKKSFPISDRVLRFCVYKQSLVSIIGGNGAAAAATNRVVGGAMCGC